MQAGLRHDTPRCAAPPDGRTAQRRCISSGDSRPCADLLRFVVDPQGNLVPDITERLPGRGIWVSADRDSIEEAISRKLFNRAARGPVSVDGGMLDRIESLLARRCIELLGLTRRSGQSVCGFEKVRAMLRGGNAALLLAASDGAADGRGKLRRLAPDIAVAQCLHSKELGQVFGREDAVHAAVAPGALAGKLIIETGRLNGIRRDDRERGQV